MQAESESAFKKYPIYIHAPKLQFQYFYKTICPKTEKSTKINNLNLLIFSKIPMFYVTCS